MNGLVADIGGTNARFALVTDGEVDFETMRTLPCRKFKSLQGAASHYLKGSGAPRPQAACLAVAGPVSGDKVSITNHHWQFSITQLGEDLGLDHCEVINDFVAIGHSLPRLKEDDRIRVDKGPPAQPQDDAESRTRHYAVIGPGTGLGVAAVTCHGDDTWVLPSEGGHISVAPEGRTETEVSRRLRRRFTRLSYERLLSGPGVVNLYQAIAKMHSTEPQNLNSELIFQAALEHSDSLCAETLDCFFGMLGAFAGDMALTFNARDGIYIGGGIVQRYPETLLASDFRARFENKGRYSNDMKHIPTYLITHNNPGLLGAAACLSGVTGSIHNERTTP